MNSLSRTLKVLDVIIASCVAQIAYAQGAIRANLEGLPAGQVLSEQFAAAGVHFARFGTADPPRTIRAPEVLSVTGQTVGRGTYFILRFDRSITSFAFDIGQESDPLLPGASPNFFLTALNAQNQGVGTTTGGSFPAEQWHHASFTFQEKQEVRSLIIEGWHSSGENFRFPIYFENIEATVVPEPRPIGLGGLGAAMLFVMLRGTRWKCVVKR
jgi:hypothetical protein